MRRRGVEWHCSRHVSRRQQRKTGEDNQIIPRKQAGTVWFYRRPEIEERKREREKLGRYSKKTSCRTGGQRTNGPAYNQSMPAVVWGRCSLHEIFSLTLCGCGGAGWLAALPAMLVRASAVRDAKGIYELNTCLGGNRAERKRLLEGWLALLWVQFSNNVFFFAPVEVME